MDSADQPHRSDPGAARADLTEQVRDPRQRQIAPYFRFTQVELPVALGPAAGRYVLRDAPGLAPTHVLVLGMLITKRDRRRDATGRRRPKAELEPDPVVVPTTRATVIDVGDPLTDETQATAWLKDAGEETLGNDLLLLNRALHAVRIATVDPYLAPFARERLLVARAGYGDGEQVADGLWTAARELPPPRTRRRRSAVLAPQARLAAMLSGREPLLACEELTLRARLDLDHGREREAALQALVALDAAIAELGASPHARELSGRLDELRGLRDQIAAAAQAALAGPLDDAGREVVVRAVERIEAALRARAVASG